MAIWQHQIFIVPEEELDSYFTNSKSLTIHDFNNIEWWKFRELNLIDIDKKFSKILNNSESWSKDLVIYGDNNKDCLQILLEDNIPVEFSARFDSRKINKDLVKLLIDFALEKDLAFLTDHSEENLEVFYPNEYSLHKEISVNKRFNDFIKQIGLKDNGSD